MERSARTPGGSARGMGPGGWWPPASRPRRKGRTAGRLQPHRPARPDRPDRPGRPPGRGHGPGPGAGHGHGHGHGNTPSGEILFFAWTLDGTEPTNQEDIFAVDAATGAVRRLTDQSSGVPYVSDRDASWSPDHSRVVFMSSDAIVPTHLPVLSAAGSPVADLPVEGTVPVWLDDTTVVCCLARLGPGGSFDRTDLVAVRVPDGAVSALTALGAGEHLGEPAWHAGSGMAATFTREDPGSGELLEQRLVVASAAAVAGVRAGGAPLVSAAFIEVAAGHDYPAAPAWSPDGSLLAFSAVRPCATTTPEGTPVRQMDLAVLTRASGAVEWVTDDTSGNYDDGLNDGSPAFSPDGQWLAWARGHEDDWTRIMVRRVGHGHQASVLLDGTHWFRWGLDW